MTTKPNTGEKRSGVAVDANGKLRVEGVNGAPSFVEPRRGKAQAAQLSWEDNGDGSWSIVVGNLAPLKAQGSSFAVFWQDDDGGPYMTAVTVEKV